LTNRRTELFLLDTHQSVALLDRHVRFLVSDLDEKYLNACTPSLRRSLALAGLATLIFWLAWLRSSESFGLRWLDIGVVEPADGPTLDLNSGCGGVLLHLSPKTKSSRTRQANVPVAYKTLSGYHLGKWFHGARRATGPSSNALVFTRENGQSWTSYYFRHAFLYPALCTLHARGDAWLMPFNDTPGNTLEAKFWSLHCFRCGARSHCTQGGRFGHHCFRKVTKPQLYEHGRWRRRHHSGEDINIVYREWTMYQRLVITLFCM
jgi:hypothetical protein